ncbi:GTPase HflX [Pseudobythopirellula maris]|uniref:GTPase HflX n=1 Tax=Pseudobythopirellula maris TaxID=2527991 RepID=A0A5C5ZUH8_9BACT|nr:GTPase HflX [Pseudobythopirellula maris]TWT90698.1 GTPase HflX [Pseudobythopirellula maris]
MEIDRKKGVHSESAVLVGVQLPDSHEESEPLTELAGLVESAGAEIVGRLHQRREAPDPAAYLGKGKLESLQQMVAAAEADVIVFDNDLSPAQVRNLEQATKVKVLDRTELILDIFSTRAQTHEARLAVELAQLEYSLPRLKRMWTHLSRLKMGVGMRGPGEKQLETDRRLVERRIVDLKRDLEKVLRRKEREVAARSDRMTVSLVGYTNAGKSTLLNRLTAGEVYAKDQLFATLDTRTRRWRLPSWGPVLLSDTVGFIRDLPHRLIASFKATLEEARQADLLLHVADASNPAVFDQIKAVHSVLAEIGIDQKDTLLVLNKADNADDKQLAVIESRYPGSVRVSAHTGDGLDRLESAVSEALSQGFVEADVVTAVGNGKLFAYLAKHGEILSRTFNEDRVAIHCRVPKKYLGRIAAGDAEVVVRTASDSGVLGGGNVDGGIVLPASDNALSDSAMDDVA